MDLISGTGFFLIFDYIIFFFQDKKRAEKLKAAESENKRLKAAKSEKHAKSDRSIGVKTVTSEKQAKSDHSIGKINFVETDSYWHIFRSFDRMWSFFILSLQVNISSDSSYWFCDGSTSSTL